MGLGFVFGMKIVLWDRFSFGETGDYIAVAILKHVSDFFLFMN